VLEPNPQWEGGNEELVADVPTPHADRITERVIDDLSRQTTLVEQDRADFMVDPPPQDRLLEVAWKYTDRFRTEITLSTYYFWMNTEQPPFDELEVRRAVNYAIDLNVLERIHGSLIATTQQVIPPGTPGYSKVLLYPHDFDRAKQLIRNANPSDRQVTVWTDDQGPNTRAGAYLESLLERLGFKAKLRTVDQDDYDATIGDAGTPNLDAGLAFAREPLAHPNELFGPLLNGTAIREAGNMNFARFDDPAVNAEIERLAREPLDPSTEDAYNALDHDVMEQAPWAPFGNREATTFTSERVDFDHVIFNPVMGQDFGSFALE
jgi:peptide/nickel transport system substrate-binding protein